jgi:hypothetical protein
VKPVTPVDPREHTPYPACHGTPGPIGRARGSALRRYAAVILLIALATSPAAHGAPETGGSALPVLHYENGVLLENDLPYGSRFVMEGSTKLARGRADVVRLAVTGQFMDGSDSARGCWVRPLKDDGTLDTTIRSFRLLIDKRPRLDEPYHFRMEFFERFAGEDPAGWIRRARRDIAALEGPINPDTVRAFLDRTYLELDFSRAGECPTVHAEGAPLRDLGGDEYRLLAMAAAAQFNLNQKTGKLGTARGDFNDAARGISAQLEEKLRAALRSGSPVRAEMPYGAGDVSNLAEALENQNPLPDSSRSTLEAFLDQDPAVRSKVLSAEEQSALDTFLVASAAYEDAVARQRQAARALASADSAAIAATDELFLLRATAEIQGTAWSDSTTVHRLRWGTAYAFGVAVLGKGSKREGTNPPRGDADADLFGAFLVRYHLGAVDTRLPSRFAYGSPVARFALDVGAVLGDVTYKGQNLENAFTGVKPMLGASYDITTDFTFHSGVLLFRQRSVNPASGDNSRIKVAPYVLLGFDFDVLNLLKGRLTSSGGT